MALHVKIFKFINYKKPSKWGIFESIILVALVSYFSYHFLQGERGVLAWLKLEENISEEDEMLSSLRESHQKLKHRIFLLRKKTLDIDMLEERARQILNVASEDEVIVDASEILSSK